MSGSRSGGVMLALLAGLACADGAKGAREVSYAQNAQTNYRKGLRELKDENFPEATKYFNFVKSKFPFSRYATLAELRIADSHFLQEKYLEAIDAYKLFVRFHPTHPRVIDGYAAFRIGESYVKQIPSDWFLVPPGHEKDQSATRDAAREMKNFIGSYPASKYRERAQTLYRQCLRLLADHELYVARFYLDRDKPKATILRLEGVLRMYPDAGVDPEVMLLLGQTYLKMNKRKEARATFAALLAKYPRDHRSGKARLYIDYIDGR